jgi:RNA polymerase sigma factor (sigma-70 family)
MVVTKPPPAVPGDPARAHRAPAARHAVVAPVVPAEVVPGATVPGDAHDFAAWYRASAPRIVRALAVDTGDPQLAADVAAEACVELLVRWDRRPPDDPSAWAMKVAFNLLRRHRRREARPASPLLIGDPMVHVDLDGIDPDLVQAVRALPPRMRRALVLRYVTDLSEREVAQGLGVQVGTASALLSQARARLAAALPRSPSRPVEVPHLA